jgi:hypothetical protein
MSSNDPPTFNTNIFNATAFIDTSETLTLNDANNLYLKKTNPSGSGTMKMTQLLLGDSTDNSSGRFISALDSAQAVSTNKFITFGQSDTLGNQVELNFFYAGSNSNNNRLGLGFYGGELMSIMRGGNVGIGTTAPAYKLEISTDSAGKPSTNTWTVSSDERIKEDIENADLDICYENVKNLKLKYFKWKDEFIEAHSIEDKHKLGWIAQDVESVIPKAVTTMNNEKYEIEDFKSLNSDQIIACLYGAVQKLIEKNEKLEEFISRLDIEEE